MLFVDNLPATRVATLVGISLDSARAIRDRQQDVILELRTFIADEYLRFFEQDVQRYYKRKAENEYQLWVKEIRKKMKALKLPPPSV